jgi:hypothetical protein
MHAPSHIRRIAVIAVLGCAMLAGWTGAAAARPIDDPTLQTTHAAASTAEPPASPAGEPADWKLPVTLAGAVVLLVVGTAGYSHRARTSRRATA